MNYLNKLEILMYYKKLPKTANKYLPNYLINIILLDMYNHKLL